VEFRLAGEAKRDLSGWNPAEISPLLVRKCGHAGAGARPIHGLPISFIIE
jgi:hypothetical protein